MEVRRLDGGLLIENEDRGAPIGIGRRRSPDRNREDKDRGAFDMLRRIEDKDRGKGTPIGIGRRRKKEKGKRVKLIV